jgi:hypothetical protein
VTQDFRIKLQAMFSEWIAEGDLSDHPKELPISRIQCGRSSHALSVVWQALIVYRNMPNHVHCAATLHRHCVGKQHVEWIQTPPAREVDTPDPGRGLRANEALQPGTETK